MLLCPETMSTESERNGFTPRTISPKLGLALVEFDAWSGDEQSGGLVWTVSRLRLGMVFDWACAATASDSAAVTWGIQWPGDIATVPLFLVSRVELESGRLASCSIGADSLFPAVYVEQQVKQQ